MNTVRTGWMLLCAAALVGGCSLWADRNDLPEHAKVVRNALEITVDAEPRTVTPGSTIRFMITARNRRGKPIAILSPTASPVIATVWRYEPGKGWERVKQFPAVDAQVVRPWRLDGHETRVFELDLPVTPNWPVLTTLKLSGELNGRPDARPHVFVYVKPQ